MYHVIKNDAASHFDHLEVTHAVVVLMLPQCHVMPTLVSHDQSLVTPCLNHLYLTSKMVPLMMSQVSYDAGTCQQHDITMSQHNYT